MYKKEPRYWPGNLQICDQFPALLRNSCETQQLPMSQGPKIIQYFRTDSRWSGPQQAVRPLTLASASHTWLKHLFQEGTWLWFENTTIRKPDASHRQFVPFLTYSPLEMEATSTYWFFVSLPLLDSHPFSIYVVLWVFLLFFPSYML